MNKFGAYGFVLLFGAIAIGGLTVAWNQRQRLQAVEQRIDEMQIEIDVLKLESAPARR